MFSFAALTTKRLKKGAAANDWQVRLRKLASLCKLAGDRRVRENLRGVWLIYARADPGVGWRCMTLLSPSRSLCDGGPTPSQTTFKTGLPPGHTSPRNAKNAGSRRHQNTGLLLSLSLLSYLHRIVNLLSIANLHLTTYFATLFSHP